MTRTTCRQDLVKILPVFETHESFQVELNHLKFFDLDVCHRTVLQPSMLYGFLIPLVKRCDLTSRIEIELELLRFSIYPLEKQSLGTDSSLDVVF
jgi:hypothetical protein